MKDDERLDLVEAEYTRIRDDSRNFWAVVAALFSVAVAIVGGLALLAQQTCPNADASSTCTAASPALWFLAPLAPITVAVLVIQQIALSTIRSTYERALEEEVAARHEVALSPPADLGVVSEQTLPSPSYSRFANRLFDVRQAPLPFRFLIGLLNVIGVVLLVGAVAMSIGEIEEGPLRVAAIALYAVLGVGLGWAVVESLNGRKMWNTAVAGITAPPKHPEIADAGSEDDSALG